MQFSNDALQTAVQKLHCALSMRISTYGAARNFPVLSLVWKMHEPIDSLCLSLVNDVRLRLLAIWQIFQIKFNWFTTQNTPTHCVYLNIYGPKRMENKCQ